MKEHKAAEETAINRFQVITPVLMAMEQGCDAAKLTQAKQEACRQNGISDRTLRRWLKNHGENGFQGLKPMPKTYHGPNTIPESLIEEAILLRREVPARSVPQIIEILEMEGKAPAGLIKRTTLQDKLMERGYSARQMKLYRDAGIAARRFARSERNDLWHSDIKFGPYISINGHKRQIYLVSFLDDATRYVIHARFYESLDASTVEDCFRTAIIKEGLPRRVYFDNGRQYRTRWMERACAKLSIKLLYAKPYSPESTGKIERFNRTVDSFLAEAAHKKLTTLAEYNHYLDVWVRECYHAKKHAGLMDAPENVYKQSSTPLRFADPETVAEAFLHCETRKVDKSGCISFAGKKYETALPLVGATVNVIYDPADTRLLTVEHPPTGYKDAAKELKISAHAGPRPKLPNGMTPAGTQTSRLLDAKERAFKERHDAVRHAIRYSGFEEEGGDMRD